MTERLADMLAVGGHANSLGLGSEVVELVLKDKPRLDELYNCLFNADSWVRMRAADALEKICRRHPEWLLPYIDRFSTDLASNEQASIQWHLAQIYRQVELTVEQKGFAINWLTQLLCSKDVDWIVSANAMDTLAQFTRDGSFSVEALIPLLNIQLGHSSNAVIKRANKLLVECSSK